MQTGTRFIRIGFAAVLTAGVLVSACKDSENPLAVKSINSVNAKATAADGSYVVEMTYPEGGKQIITADVTDVSSSMRIAAIMAAPTGAALTTGTETGAYNITEVPFAPITDALPNTAYACDDCTTYDVPLAKDPNDPAFNFTFFGNTYQKVDFTSNGLIGFGGSIYGEYLPRSIPVNDDLNNLIALAWADWYTPGGGTITYGTVGSAPNRMWVLNFDNVCHFSSSGCTEKLTAQLVLHEGSNDITMYVTSMTLPGAPFFPVATQGIENSDGTVAFFVPGRVEASYSMTNVAIRFSTQAANTAPSIAAPPNVTFSTDGGVCTRTVSGAALGTPTATDDESSVTVVGVRGDGAQLTDAFPTGTTTITWTATDVGGLTASADQTVTVNDTEAPTIVAPAPQTVGTDAGQPTAFVNPGAASATDNCGDVTVTNPPAGNFPIGTTTVTYTATDGSGNSSSASSSITVADYEPPTLIVPSSVTVYALAPDGATVTYLVGAYDNSLSVETVCTPASGQLFGIGVTGVICTATDGSGNTTSKNFNVTVLSARDQLLALIDFTTRLSLQPGTSSPLLSMLATALRDPGVNSPDVACSKLADFIRKLQDHKAVASISEANINQMIADATRIRNVLGCGPLP